jgi:hypothetical protein
LSDKITSVVGGKVVLCWDFFRSSHEFKIFIINWQLSLMPFHHVR